MSSEKVDELLSKLHSILTKMRYVKAGDIVLASDHNLCVDALKVMNDIVNALNKRALEIEEVLRKYVCGVLLEEEVQLLHELFGTWFLEEDVSKLPSECVDATNVQSEDVSKLSSECSISTET